MNAIAYRVEPGYRFPEETLVITEERQRWLHACCDIPYGFYGDRADPSILAARPIKVIGQALFANYSDRGYVHTQSRIRQHAPIPLETPVIDDGPLHACGRPPARLDDARQLHLPARRTGCCCSRSSPGR